MNFTRTATVAALLLTGALSAHAETATLTPKAQYTADTKAAQERYRSDLTICDEQPGSSARMQCKRDAKAEYDKALAEAKTRLSTADAQAKAVAACTDCGKVLSVTQVEKEGEGSALGMIAGGAAGALLGRQIGGGSGRDLATIAGAAGGAYAGREVEKKMKTRTVWAVQVSFPNGEKPTYEFAENPGFKAGDVVKKSNQTIVRP